MAFANRRPAGGLIFLSDRGCQYTSGAFATIKRELIDGRTWPAREVLRRAVFDYIEGWYNTRGLHSSLGYVSPGAYEAVHSHAGRQAA